MRLNSTGSLQCKLCGARDVRLQFSEMGHGQVHNSYHCSACDVYMTLGKIPPVSPDYIQLDEADLSDEHIYLQRAHKVPAFEQWAKTVQRLSGPDAELQSRSLLDIGCGVGGFLDFAAQRHLRTYGFDASDAQIRIARDRHPHVRCCTSIEQYVELVPDAPPFDLVTMWDVLEHIRDPQILLQSVRKNMSPAGLFFASVPSGAPTRAKLTIAKFRGREPGLIPWEHVFYYTKRSLHRLLEVNGFDVLAVDGVAPYVRALDSHEVIRRAVHRLLLHTPYALQIFVLARPSC